MTGAEIIAAFELQVSDLTELSTVEEYQILDRVYKKLMAQKPWEITKKEASGVLSTTLPYVSLPDDFLFMVANHDYRGVEEYAGYPVVFIGDNYTPYRVVSFSDRRQYRGNSNVCYVDIVNRRLYFTIQPTAASAYEFDYQSVPDAITANTSPVFPESYHPILVHLMATEDFILQLSDKAKSYAPENAAKADSYFGDMAYWNANLVQL